MAMMRGRDGAVVPVPPSMTVTHRPELGQLELRWTPPGQSIYRACFGLGISGFLAIAAYAGFLIFNAQDHAGGTLVAAAFSMPFVLFLGMASLSLLLVGVLRRDVVLVSAQAPGATTVREGRMRPRWDVGTSQFFVEEHLVGGGESSVQRLYSLMAFDASGTKTEVLANLPADVAHCMEVALENFHGIPDVAVAGAAN